ncbi:MAG: DUF2304 domain-containing protein [Chloroflexi bacterium]|nr:DUF2304 domain-containing protein [Chloroflexota bacterium]
MIDRSIVFTVGAALIALLVVLELVRRRRLSEEYSLLWLGTAVIMLILGLWRDLLHSLAALVGIYDPSNLLFLLAALFMLFIQLYFSTVITRLTQESKESAQQIALLRLELEQLRGEQVNSEKDDSD